jgi:hypothetical protein
MRHPARRIVRFVSLLVPLAFFCISEPGHAQDQMSAVTVSVRTAGELRPLAGAQVIVQGIGIGGSTRQDGRITLFGLRPGTRTVEVRYLGYAPQQAQVTLEPYRTSEVRFEMQIEPIRLAEVKVRTRASRLLRTGFYQRRSSGFGTFFTRDQIQNMNPRALSDVMRRVAGASVYTGRAGLGSANFRGGRGTCPVQFYIDGTMASLFLIDEMRPEDVEGIEIYRGAATIPPEYNKGTAMCGVIVIWTRDR